MRHLWFVIAELPGPPEQVVVVKLTSKREGSDTTVVFHSGDHRFIKHDSVISYYDARIFSKDDLVNRIEQKLFEEDDPFPKDKLTVIQQGLLRSPFTEKDIKEACREVFGQESSVANADSPPTAN